MSGKLCLISCQNFYRELEAVIAAEGWTDVSVAAFPSRCGCPPVGWDELRPLIEEDCTQLVILGRACLHGLGNPPKDWPSIRLLTREDCFHLVAGNALIAEAIERGAYLMMPSWIVDWRGNLRKMGFDEGGAAKFFRESCSELLLLDTGIVADAPCKLAELAETINLPASRLPVGIDYVRQQLGRLVAEWRLEEAQQLARKRERDHIRELADHKTAMDFLGQLPLLNDELETVAAIEEMFYMLFAPQEFHYLPYEGDAASCHRALSPDLARQIQALKGDWAWTETKTGFLLRIARAGEPLGVVVVDQFAFPEYGKHYLNLALAIAGVAGLAIDNARTYRRIKQTEEALRKSEHSLLMAQAMAHLGHWELDVDSNDIHWSNEIYRILGYSPEKHTPSFDNFLLAIHPEDRARVASRIDEARRIGSFDIEFRIVLADNQVRVMHSLGELIRNGDTVQSPGFLTHLNINKPGRVKLLCVIQDVTEQKELQWRLEQEAHTDALTGCNNRRYFLELAGRELTRARRYSAEISVLMLDLDHFKAINDRYGHPIGDLVLQRLVQVCKTILRAEDEVGRLGGEEFAILLPETGYPKVQDVAERLCSAISAAKVSWEGGSPIRFTASIGMATLTPEDFNIAAILGRADRALYEAKHAGRNRVAAA